MLCFFGRMREGKSSYNFFGLWILRAYCISDVFASTFRGLNKPWEPCKEHSFFHLSSKWLLGFLAFGESLSGRVLEKSFIEFEDNLYSLFSCFDWGAKFQCLMVQVSQPSFCSSPCNSNRTGSICAWFPTGNTAELFILYFSIHIIVIHATASGFIF